ncbi:hypothetical protein MMF93_00045 [Streptomyces tubbatahanensis]|uniref:Uncharacterized protein n=1 Tax=Streptomyces tubbatahanensis TaxID=2923272 RepID=A0ABY3XKV8_9ACTN|nr:hypothetical protein [Streptomyces tubbatahanensis]UNS95031.1 hypothetical protein MMF93_00045 [Streptomyces tubbatahanensis]
MAENNEGDFVKFLNEFETSEPEHMATAHHSAVNVREWAEPTKSETKA